MEADDALLPTGRIFDVNEVMYAMYDLREPVPVDFLKLDHVYTRLDKPAPSIVDYKSHALQLHISATDDFTHVVIYSPQQPPFFSLSIKPARQMSSICIHQGTALREAAHLLEVQPGATSSGTLRYNIVSTA